MIVVNSQEATQQLREILTENPHLCPLAGAEKCVHPTIIDERCLECPTLNDLLRRCGFLKPNDDLATLKADLEFQLNLAKRISQEIAKGLDNLRSAITRLEFITRLAEVIEEMRTKFLPQEDQESQ